MRVKFSLRCLPTTRPSKVRIFCSCSRRCGVSRIGNHKLQWMFPRSTHSARIRWNAGEICLRRRRAAALYKRTAWSLAELAYHLCVIGPCCNYNCCGHASSHRLMWKSPAIRAYEPVCVFWRIVASMVLRHRTLLRHFSWQLMYKDVVVSGLLRRQHSSYHLHVEPLLVIVRFRLLRRVPGILFQLRSGKSGHCLPSAGNWRQHCLPSLFRQTDREII